MDGKEFLKRAKHYAKKTGQQFKFDPQPGKGSHGKLIVGAGRTMVQRGELATGVFHAMLKQLGIDKKDF